jgi:hypothetical protein
MTVDVIAEQGPASQTWQQDVASSYCPTVNGP